MFNVASLYPESLLPRRKTHFFNMSCNWPHLQLWFFVFVYYVLKDYFLQNFSRIDILFQDQSEFRLINRTENLYFLFCPLLETTLQVFWYFNLLQKFFKIIAFPSEVTPVSFIC